MAELSFSDSAAERLERVYSGYDVTAQRADTLKRLGVRSGEHVIDIGSGPGFLCQDLAEAVGSSGRVRGVDISVDMVSRASGRNDKPWLSYAEADATALPEPDAAFDVAVSTQVAEYVPDVAAFCAEFHRVLKPGGRGLIIATDWDAVIWQTEHPERMARMLKSFEPHCADPRLPRRLAPLLRGAGLSVDHVSCYPLINLRYEVGAYSHGVAGFIADYAVKTGAVAPDEVEAWKAELAALDAEGRYFFANSRFVFECSRLG